MESFLNIKPMMPSAKSNATVLAESTKLREESNIQCHGCAAKLSHEDLVGSFGRLSPTAASLLDDDACESTVDGHRYLLQSIDGLTDLVGDPFIFGQIALEHACNDVLAKGVRPSAALVSVDIPRASSLIMRDTLGQLTSGFQKACSTHRIHYLGGHTSVGDELKVHCAITAWHNESVVWSKGKCRHGDLIVLTKPIGTAAIFAAHMQGLCKGVWREQAIQSMLQSHTPIMAVLRQHDISSGTDITGFGLGMHLAQLVKGQDELSIQINVDELACLDGFLEVTDCKVRSSLFEANLVALSQLAHPSLCDDLSSAKLCNPETSGPLALAIPPQHANALVNQLQKHGFERARVIGRVVHKPEQGHTLLPFTLPFLAKK
jgi:selenide,water dikinase